MFPDHRVRSNMDISLIENGRRRETNDAVRTERSKGLGPTRVGTYCGQRGDLRPTHR